MPAVAITDRCQFDGAFHFVQDILNHNKIVEAKNKERLKKEKILQKSTKTDSGLRVLCVRSQR